MGQKPDLSHLRVFGCLCFVATSPVGRDKFMSRSHPYVLIGYPTGQKAYKVPNLVNKHIHVSRDVIFFEDLFPLHSMIKHPLHSSFSHLPTNSTDILENSNYTPEPSYRHSHTNDLIPPSIATHRSTRIHQPPIRLQDYICNQVGFDHICCHTLTNMCIPDVTFTSSTKHNINHSFAFHSKLHVP